MTGKQQNILITGGAGFIGSSLADQLLAAGCKVTGLDNFNDFYDPDRKRRNIKDQLDHPNYRLVEGDIRNDLSWQEVFSGEDYDAVVHLAAMAGVRPSMNNPQLYMDVNVNGTQKLLDRLTPRTRLIFASSSSVYGERGGEYFLETDRVDQPLSPYAASKAAGELICHAAHHTRDLQIVCLRFFTVFGPRQRPDLAIHKFCRQILAGETVELFGDGSSERDYTFITDILSGIRAAMTYDCPGFDIINLGRSQPVALLEMVDALESALGRKAKVEHKPPQAGDMPYTFAGIDKARKVLGYDPQVPFGEGVRRFVDWYVENKTLVV